MIYTVTFNPSLDYILHVDHFQYGSVNRSQQESLYPGGKGINMAIVLSRLGIPCKCLGFIAGFTGERIQQMLDEIGCPFDFIQLAEGYSRINVKIKAQQESEINGQGPIITKFHIQQLFKKLENLQDGDILALAGSIPNTLPQDIYVQIMKRIPGHIPVAVDATKDLLFNVLKYKPFLIKPNHLELGELFGKTLKNKKEIIDHAKKLQLAGAKNVLVSMAGEGAILLDETGKVHEALPPKGIVVNSVGAGDSMVAGFLTGYLKTKSYALAFQMSIAAGSATAFSPWLATREEIFSLIGHQEKIVLKEETL